MRVFFRSARLLIVVFGLISFSAPNVIAQLLARSVNESLQAGKEIRIHYRGTVDPRNCTIYDPPAFRPGTSPKLGTLTVKTGEVVITPETRGTGGKCVGMKTKITEIWYKSNGQRGVDKFNFYLVSAVGWTEFVEAEAAVD